MRLKPIHWLAGGLVALGTYGALKKAQAQSATKKGESDKSSQMRVAIANYFAQNSKSGRALWFEQIKNTFFLDNSTVSGILESARLEDKKRVEQGKPPVYPGSQTDPATLPS